MRFSRTAKNKHHSMVVPNWAGYLEVLAKEKEFRNFKMGKCPYNGCVTLQLCRAFDNNHILYFCLFFQNFNMIVCLSLFALYEVFSSSLSDSFSPSIYLCLSSISLCVFLTIIFFFLILRYVCFFSFFFVLVSQSYYFSHTHPFFFFYCISGISIFVCYIIYQPV